MNIFQRIGNAIFGGNESKSGPMTETTKAPALMPSSSVSSGTPSSGGFAYLRNEQTHPVLRFLDKQQIETDPRRGLVKFRWMVRQVGPYAAAENALLSFIGRPEIIAPEGSKRADKKLIQMLNDWWERLPIYGKMINDLSADHGLDSFVNSVYKYTLSDGSSFVRRMQQPTTGRINKQPIEGLHLLDGLDVQVVQDPRDLMREMFQWMPQNGQGLIDMSPELGFSEFHLDNVAGYSWGLPLAYKGDVIAVQAMRALIAYITSMERQANPIGITMISGDPKTNAIGVHADALVSLKKEETAQQQAIFDEYKAAVKNRNISNSAQDIIMQLNYPAKLESSYYGQGMTMPRNFSQDAEQLSQQIAQFLPVPRVFLGISAGAAGIGSDLFRVQKAQMMGKIERDRRLLEANLIRTITDAHLITQSVLLRPDLYKVHWEAPDIDDEKLEAETEKLEAETVAAQMANVQSMFMTFSGSPGLQEAIAEYMEECGLPTGLQMAQPMPAEPIPPL